MQISSLEITNLRVIEHLQISPGDRLNFIVGPNGAGKTSILEAIYLAGRGRTFRHTDAGPMIRQGSESATVFVELRDPLSGRTSKLGLRREKRRFSCRLDGQDVNRRSSLAEALPVQWIGSQPQSLLQMGPEVRRRFIDMGLFHVEHRYLAALTDFQRALRQRNAATREGSPPAVSVWDRTFAQTGETLTGYRESFIADLMTKVVALLARWQVGFVVGYRFRPGWSPDKPLQVQLAGKLDLDLRMGYSTIGPQRAEWELLADGVNAERKLSRGQQKVLVLALHLALWDMISERQSRTPVLLIDDLAAELDARNRAQMIFELEERPVQGFLTMIDPHVLRADRTLPAVFHVKHGIWASDTNSS